MRIDLEKLMGKPKNNVLELSGKLFLSHDETKMTAKIERKEPSTIGLLLLIFITLSLYSFSFYQLSKTVNNFVDTVVEKVEQD